ncbi:MAG: cobalamin biosynthesis protein [Candidatus Nitrosopelagicus sp.]|jgi:adenosylcobinamide-phosphate synthase|nr:cobalamin biosynthesis protein [Candidatus Nitrosopelagicus sp.]MBT4326894.1 cobalamin biosynthesis protein [Candidatus Nitrosopelagicus sp.]MBT4454382.1 cobalamin biosynthesis protein [Candidatus Nitrosopelagicus sp.]MBT6647541.1 cobalamin biosynthesis protein [Nitrososphaerota archaeon]|tara:strand:- start:1542 stop:2513 length:972 start_codon:yes stop_codon:yes gene_type:complete
MILESIIIIGFAIILDLIFGDPKNRYHPTAWIGNFIGSITTCMKNGSQNLEKFGGIFIVLIPVSISCIVLFGLEFSIDLINAEFWSVVISTIFGIILFKMTIAIRGMELHALAVLDSIQKNDLAQARKNLSMIVKRNTKNLDKNHILSGTLESLSENIVDGITGPMFYFALFGLPGAFAYRIVNTVDSMVGYKTYMFKNLGWFGANCDNILNYIPSRLTGLTMVLGAMLLGHDWKNCYAIFKRDGKKTDSPNAGYPMAALAGALGTTFEKIEHYSLGSGNQEITSKKVTDAIALMKVTSLLFFGIVSIPIILFISLMESILIA